MNTLLFDILKLIWKNVIIEYPTKEEVWYHNINYICIDKLQTKVFLDVLKSITKKLPSVLQLISNPGFSDNDFRSIELPGIKFGKIPILEIIFKEKQSKENLGGDYFIRIYDENNKLLKTIKKHKEKQQVKLDKFLVGCFSSNNANISFFMSCIKEKITIEWIIEQYKRIYTIEKCEFPNLNIIGLSCNKGVLKLLKD